VPGATVSLTGPAAPRTTTTDANGDFHFLQLSPAGYAVTLDLPDKTARREAKIELGKNIVLSIPLAVAGATKSVNVRTDAPLLASCF
jgi:hypothetical protein